MANHFALISPEGSFVMPMRWNGPRETLPRFFEIRMLDEAFNDLPQPYPDPPEHRRQTVHFWVIDTQQLPGGWQIVDLTEAQWEETQVSQHLKVWDGTDVQIRPGALPAKDREHRWVERQRLEVVMEDGLELSHYGHGGSPIFKIDRASKKTEVDFPLLTFTHVEEDRIVPISPEERMATGLKNAAILAMAKKT
jgi:hypothetical protein